MVAGIGLEWLKQGLGCCSGERELLGAAGWEVMLLRVFPWLVCVSPVVLSVG